jgi:hypothetical protein
MGLPVLLVFMTGCGTLVTYYASFNSNSDGNADESILPTLQADPFLIDMARKFGVFALFAGVVYRDDYAPEERDGFGCGYLQPSADPKRIEFGMPRDLKGADKVSGWKRWIPVAVHPSVDPCFDRDGLYYETYVLQNTDGELVSAVIAFRGTENRSGQYWTDWRSNFAAAFGLEPEQYAMARERIPRLAAALKERLKKDSSGGVDLFAVGHSLGGGLAQQAGFLAPEIRQVITFNTTPVTNWTHLRLDKAVRKAYPTIYRIYHGGEILEKLRFLSTSFTQTRYARHDIGLQFEGRQAFAGHSMQVIMCNMAKIVAQQGALLEAEHHYPLSYIRGEVLALKSLCPSPEEGASVP